MRRTLGPLLNYFKRGESKLAILSILILLFLIFFGFWKKVNIGITSFGAAMILGMIAGMKSKEIIAGFGTSLFVTLLGVFTLFSIAQANGTIELMAQKTVALVGKKTFLIPVVLYVVSCVLSMIGPGPIPVFVPMAAFSVSIACQTGFDPIVLASISTLGSFAGGPSPITPQGIIVANLSEKIGYTGISNSVFANVMFSTFICAAVIYFVYGCHKVRATEKILFSEMLKFNQQQIITMVSILVMLVAVLILGYDIGLVCFLISAILVICRVADEKQMMKGIPWGTLILITGVGVYMNVVIKVGGINLLSKGLMGIMTSATVAPIMGLTGGIMSWFSSMTGVVLPTLIPTLGVIAGKFSAVSYQELISAIYAAAAVAGCSPVSTGGGAALAAYVACGEVDSNQQIKAFNNAFLISVICVVVAVLCAFSGMFRVIGNMFVQ